MSPVATEKQEFQRRSAEKTYGRRRGITAPAMPSTSQCCRTPSSRCQMPTREMPTRTRQRRATRGRSLQRLSRHARPHVTVRRRRAAFTRHATRRARANRYRRRELRREPGRGHHAATAASDRYRIKRRDRRSRHRAPPHQQKNAMPEHARLMASPEDARSPGRGEAERRRRTRDAASTPTMIEERRKAAIHVEVGRRRCEVKEGK